MFKFKPPMESSIRKLIDDLYAVESPKTVEVYTKMVNEKEFNWDSVFSLMFLRRIKQGVVDNETDEQLYSVMKPLMYIYKAHDVPVVKRLSAAIVLSGRLR